MQTPTTYRYNCVETARGGGGLVLRWLQGQHMAAWTEEAVSTQVSSPVRMHATARHSTHRCDAARP